MKFCNQCSQNKPFEDFNKNKRKRDGLQSQCRSCQKKQNNSGYKTNPNRSKSIKQRRDRVRKYNYSLITRYKRFCGCKICDEKEPVALDFHHLESESKENNVSSLASISTERLKVEIRKCVVLCANCHRKFHAGLVNF